VDHLSLTKWWEAEKGRHLIPIWPWLDTGHFLWKHFIFSRQQKTHKKIHESFRLRSLMVSCCFVPSFSPFPISTRENSPAAVFSRSPRWRWPRVRTAWAHVPNWAPQEPIAQEMLGSPNHHKDTYAGDLMCSLRIVLLHLMDILSEFVFFLCLCLLFSISCIDSIIYIHIISYIYMIIYISITYTYIYIERDRESVWYKHIYAYVV
jgi:hypothetical protein